VQFCGGSTAGVSIIQEPQVAKIEVANPVVELDGEEMTRII
jgi:isocitrate dehydrogenase